MSEYYIKDGLVYRSHDNAQIPAWVGNSDWDAYQAWLAAGNTPQPYEQPVVDPKEQAKADLANTDKEMARIAEDLINTLISKGIIAAKDLPKAASDKLVERTELRKALK